MGLFDGGKKLKDAENEVLQKLSECPLLDMLIENIQKEQEEEPWLQMGQNYYDNCKRVVTVEPDGFEIKWIDEHQEPYTDQHGILQHRDVKELLGRIGYSYTRSGYVPLHEYRYDDGNRWINTKRVCYLWASIIRERMAAKMPNCKFDDIAHDEYWGDITFTYTVPALTFKDWF